MKFISKWFAIIALFIFGLGSTSFAGQSEDFQKMMELAKATSALGKHKNEVERSPNQVEEALSQDPQLKEGNSSQIKNVFHQEGRHSSPKIILNDK